MEWIIALLILLLVLSFVWNMSSKDIDRSISCFFTIMISSVLTGALIDYNSKNNPTALDVYQGKTTLEITYKDNIPVDSVVVLKENVK